MAVLNQSAMHLAPTEETLFDASGVLTSGGATSEATSDNKISKSTRTLGYTIGTGNSLVPISVEIEKVEHFDFLLGTRSQTEFHTYVDGAPVEYTKKTGSASLTSNSFLLTETMTREGEFPSCNGLFSGVLPSAITMLVSMSVCTLITSLKILSVVMSFVEIIKF